MTQEEHAAAVAAAERRGIERAAALIQQQAAQAQGFADKHLSAMDNEAWQGCADLYNESAAAILALPPSDGDALAEAIQRAVMQEREAIAVWHDKRAADDAAPTRDTESVNAGVLRRIRSTWHEAQAAAIRARGEAGR